MTKLKRRVTLSTLVSTLALLMATISTVNAGKYKPTKQNKSDC